MKMKEDLANKNYVITVNDTRKKKTIFIASICSLSINGIMNIIEKEFFFILPCLSRLSFDPRRSSLEL